MPIRLTCSCGKVLSAPDAAAGKAIKCPGCQKAIRVPGGGEAGKPAATAKATGAKATGAAKPASPNATTPAKGAAARPAGAVRPAAAGTAPSLPATPTAATTVDGSLDDLFNEAGFQLRTGKTCPSCLAALDQDAVLCTQCGLHLTSGQKLQGHVTEFEDEQSGEAYLKRAALDMERSKQMQEKMSKGAGMPWWMLMLVLFFLSSVTAVGVIAVNMSRREDATETFDAVGTLLMLSAIGMWAISIGATLLVLYRAFLESAQQGLMVLFIPFYILYYGISRFAQVGKPLILSILASSIAGGLFAAYAQRMQ